MKIIVSAISLVLLAAGCARNLPPTDAQIQQAIYAELTLVDMTERMSILEAAGQPANAEIVGISKDFSASSFESAGCAKSGTSAGYICTIDMLVAYKRPSSQLWPQQGLRKISGPIELYHDPSENWKETQGWKLVDGQIR